jgi:ABC-type branched-subunit amino acid transport system substrate-binding protein
VEPDLHSVVTSRWSEALGLETTTVAWARTADFRVALVVPLQGPEGMYGPSCELCARLAAEEINAGSGILGRELSLVTVDGAAHPAAVADEIDALITAGQVDAVVGWHISAVREGLAPRIAQRVPYIYTALYEGGERTPGVFLTGETPDAQIRPAMRWMAQEVGVDRWCIVGNDYVWPRRSAAESHRYARDGGAEILDEVFLERGTSDFAATLRRVERSECDGVLMYLVGDDAVQFHRQFAAAGLDERCVRLTPLMDENMLLATGAGGQHGALHRRRLLRDAAHGREPRVQRTVRAPFRRPRAGAQQPGGVLLRGAPAARGPGAGGRQRRCRRPLLGGPDHPLRRPARQPPGARRTRRTADLPGPSGRSRLRHHLLALSLDSIPYCGSYFLTKE